MILEAKLNLIPLPKAKAVLVIHFTELLDALGATHAVLTHGPRGDGPFVLDHTRNSPAPAPARDHSSVRNAGACVR